MKIKLGSNSWAQWFDCFPAKDWRVKLKGKKTTFLDKQREPSVPNPFTWRFKKNGIQYSFISRAGSDVIDVDVQVPEKKEKENETIQYTKYIYFSRRLNYLFNWETQRCTFLQIRKKIKTNLRGSGFKKYILKQQFN